MFVRSAIASLLLSASIAAAQQAGLHEPLVQQETDLPRQQISSVQQPPPSDQPSSSQQQTPNHTDDTPPAQPNPRPRPTPVTASDTDLPDSPGASVEQQEDVVVAGKAYLHSTGEEQKPCTLIRAMGMIYFDPRKVDETRPRCSELVYPYQRFLDTNIAVPLNWKQKGYLAAHFTTDLSAIGTTIGISAISIAADSHSAYGPGLKGFGKLAGISVLQNATAEFFGTFAVPSFTHQDPRYYRMPQKPFAKRILYSITRSYISRSDDGRTIPNYGTLATYPIVAELSNLYVPGIQSDGASTTERILTGLALDPVNNLVNEFLPDLASRVHVRIIFVQQILNNIAVSNNGSL